MPPKKESLSDRSKTLSDAELVRQELNTIAEYFRDGEGGFLRDKNLKHLGTPRFQQKDLIGYVHHRHKAHWLAVKKSESGLRQTVKRELDKLLEREPAFKDLLKHSASVDPRKNVQDEAAPAKKALHRHKASGSSSPARRSTADTLDALQERVDALESFKLRMEAMFQSGRPEPEGPAQDGKSSD